MINQTTETIAAYKLLASPQNIVILKALRRNPSKAKDLESVVHLDRMSIKRRLYKMVEAGLVKEEKVKSKKAVAIVYSIVNNSFPKVSIFKILDDTDSDKIYCKQ